MVPALPSLSRGAMAEAAGPPPYLISRVFLAAQPRQEPDPQLRWTQSLLFEDLEWCSVQTPMFPALALPVWVHAAGPVGSRDFYEQGYFTQGTMDSREFRKQEKKNAARRPELRGITHLRRLSTHGQFGVPQ